MCRTQTFDWQSSLSQVINNNPELQGAKESYESIKVQEGAAKSGFLPNLSAGVSSTQSYNAPLSSQSQRSEAANLTVSENLFSGFSDLSKFREAQQNSLIANFQYRQSKAKISSDFRIAYASLIYAQESVHLAQTIMARRKENLNIVQLRFASGRENKGSVLLSEAYLQQAVYDSIQADLQLEVARNSFSQVLGLSISESKISVEKDIPKNDLLEYQDFDFKKLATLTLEYQKAVAQSTASQFSFEQSQAAFYPSLDLTGTLGKTDSVFPPANDRWSIGLSLTIPIYSGGRDWANKESAKYRKLSADINQATVSYQAIVKLKQAYLQYKLAIEKVKVDEKFKLAAEMRSEIAKKKYNNGLMSFEDWDLVENDRIQREKSNLLSFRDRIVGQANWEQTQGIGLVP